MKNLSKFKGAKRLSKLEQKHIIGGKKVVDPIWPMEGGFPEGMGLCFQDNVMQPCGQACSNGQLPLCTF